MDNQTLISKSDEIFATGVFLQPVNCIINGIQQWHWVAVGFEEDSFLDGKIINPIEYGDNIEELVGNFED